MVVDLMYATGHPDYGLGRLLSEQGRFDDANYREDACGADSEDYHVASIAVIQRLYGHVLGTQDVIDRLESRPAGVEARALAG